MGAREKFIRSMCEYAYAGAEGAGDIFSVQGDGFSYTGNLFCDVTGGFCSVFMEDNSLTAEEAGDCDYRMRGFTEPESRGQMIIVLPASNVTMENAERVLIGKVIGESNGNISRAAERLGINRTTLYNKLKKYGITK